jgi:hypothetical protein
MNYYLISDGRSFRLVTGTPGSPEHTGALTPPMPSVEDLRDALTAGLQACGEPARPAREFTYARVGHAAAELPDRPEGGG